MPNSQTTRRAFNFAADQAWAILEESFENILTIAARENDTDLEAVEKKLGRPLNNTQDTTTRDGVAVIPVMGPIFRYANIFSMISGATTVDDLARDFNTALEDPAVSAILLNVDSPGGMVNGVSEFSSHIAAARGKKPIVAYIADTGASAAYWIASAADEIVVSDTAKVGSIGAVITYRKGEDPTTGKIISSQSPYKQADPNNPEGRGKVQAMIDSLADVFIDTVAQNRGVSKETVMSDFGQGGMFVGKEAVTAGLADKVGSFEGVLASLSKSSSGYQAGHKSVFVSNKGENPVFTVDQIKTEAPEVAASLKAEGKQEALAEIETVKAQSKEQGAKEERERIQAIEAKGALIPGHAALVAEMKFDGKTTPEQAADRILSAEGRVRTDAMANIVSDAPKPLAQPAADAQPATSVQGVYSEEACKALWDKDPKIQAEFGTFAAYNSFEKAYANGQARIMGVK